VRGACDAQGLVEGQDAALLTVGMARQQAKCGDGKEDRVLIRTSGFNGIETGGFLRRVEPEDYAHRPEKPTAIKMTSRRIKWANQSWRPIGWRPAAQQDADDASGNRQRERLDQKLRQHVARPRAHSHADAILACALGDTDEHDVHDADAAHDERHRGDAGQKGGQTS